MIMRVRAKNVVLKHLGALSTAQLDFLTAGIRARRDVPFAHGSPTHTTLQRRRGNSSVVSVAGARATYGIFGLISVF